MKDSTERGLALFDMDGTLFRGDSQVSFFFFVVKRHPWRCLLMLVYALCLPLYVFRVLNESQMKRLFLCYLWRMSPKSVDSYARSFATLLVDRMYPEMLDRLRDHRERGDSCVLVSASPDVYVRHVGELLHFTRAFGTEMIMVNPMPLLPVLPHGNHKGAAKLVHLRALGILPNEGVVENGYVYSDSSADLPMLRACRHRILVNPSRTLCECPEMSEAVILEL